MGTPIRLKALLRQRHWQVYRTFQSEYDRTAAGIDPKLVGTWPSRAQFNRWLSGELKGLPYPDHCRILVAMFPGWTAEQLFEPVADDPTEQAEVPGESPADAPQRSPLMQTIAAGLRTPDTAHREWGAPARDSGPPPLGPQPPDNDDDQVAYALGRRLLALARVLRLDAEEVNQLAALAGTVVNLHLSASTRPRTSPTSPATSTHRSSRARPSSWSSPATARGSTSGTGANA